MVSDKLVKLSLERTVLANERTMLAQVRTGFTSLLFGLALIEFFDTNPLFVYLGGVLIGLSIVFLFLGFTYYFKRRRQIKRLAGNI